ncbi:MAG: alpha-L-rhamnosidase N-terminal domain-containing protein [Clostridia bacterium]|nr:alpha-L-rhamnosidase N-terminal domain-containing protein [Clostridia bacterium]
MEQLVQLTDIKRIGLVKRTGDEWSYYRKTFNLEAIPCFAAVRVDSMGVIGIYVNGEFIEGITGRYPGRIGYFEFTSRLKKGENKIEIKLGNHYYPLTKDNIFARRGANFSAFAVEIELINNGKRTTIVSDESWEVTSDDGQTKPEFFSEVTVAEYDRLWTAATLWPEQKEIVIPEAVASFAGKDYVDYAKQPPLEYAYPEKVIDTNMITLADGTLTSSEINSKNAWLYDVDDARPYVCYAFDRLYVGYIELEYESEEDNAVYMRTDYSESADDLVEGNRYEYWLRHLDITTPIKKGRHTIRLNHRRAGRYLKLRFENDIAVRVISVRYKVRMMAHERTGWFNCNEEILNTAWEMGKYTLHINKHEEYESCPRNEMKFFAGDGVIDALIDQYVFGENSLVNTSLSHTEPDGAGGDAHDKFERHCGLWDYPAWRIITVHNYYKFSGDVELIKRYFDELVECIVWQIERSNSRELIYQDPVLCGAFHIGSASIEYNSSFDRLGEKPMNNALLYKSLLCMQEMGKIMGDERADAWGKLAEKVKIAINENLWSEKDGAYLDSYDTGFVPQDGNALALLFGVADKERANTIMETLERENWSPYGSAILSKEVDHTRGGVRCISPVMNMYEAEARFLLGKEDSAVELIRRTWGTMIKKGAKTFWEFTANNGNETWPIPAHAWAGGCTYLLSAYVAGVRPESIGFDTIHYEPYDKMDFFTCVVPLPRGFAVSKCKTVGGKKQFELLVPKNTLVNAYLPEGATLEITEY